MSLSQRLLPLLHGLRPPAHLGESALLGLLGGVGRLYGWHMVRRRSRYKADPVRSYRPRCPVISIGNITTGGTGKTPCSRWLAGYLQQQGIKTAIVSRGYGQQSKLPVTVVSDGKQIITPPPLAADEPTMLARALPGVAVLCGPNRKPVIEHAIEKLGCELILLDDAFQHLKAARDLNIVLLDAAHPLGNGQLLPGGVLREPASALQDADIILLSRAHDDEQAVRAEKMLRPHLQPNTPILRADHRATGWQPLTQGAPPHPPGKLLAFTGIGRPESFWHSLQCQGITPVATRSFADHHPFCAEDLAALQQQAQALGATALACTEKDAVKIDPAWYTLPLYQLQIEWHFLTSPAPLEAAVSTLLAKQRHKS
uniref:Tetraacyldisaccharide 4'-kinase n=1 Tax=Magnetococcus massalia (strain MO-1) TaxID=451514 RepID=A0A1S7LHD4_MAGMO|nr:Tetraacyldisaccharide 4'-kinase [Candidatus Magnetococcus massalia]